MIYAVIVATIAIIATMAFYQASQKGKYKERSRSLEEEKESVDEALNAQDDVVTDPDYRKRVRDEYDG